MAKIAEKKAGGVKTAAVRAKRAPLVSGLRMQQAKRWLRDLLVRPLSLKDVTVLCRQLLAVDQAGIPAVRGLSVIAEQAGGLRMRRLLKQMAAQIRCGANFSDVADWHRGRFPSFFVEMVSSGEATGRLDVAFTHLAEHYEERLRLRRDLFNAMLYPLLVLGVIFVMPLFQGMLVNFAGGGGPDLGDLFWGMARRVAVWVIQLWLIIRLRIPQALWRLFGGHLPYLSEVARGFAMSRFFQCLAMLLEGGYSTARSIGHAARVSGNVPITLSLSPAAERVRGGETLTEALSVSPYVDDTARAMLAVGEASGKIDETLRKLSQYAQERAMHRLRILIVALESVLIFILGLMIIL